MTGLCLSAVSNLEKHADKDIMHARLIFLVEINTIELKAILRLSPLVKQSNDSIAFQKSHCTDKDKFT
jgi:hypothetical protein